jgi:hypothetical protein
MGIVIDYYTVLASWTFDLYIFHYSFTVL